MKAYYAAMPPDQRARKRAYKAIYDATHQEQNRAYRDANQEHRKANKKDWYLRNRQHVLKRVKARSVEKREDILAYQARYYAENTDKVKANVRSYRKANPDKKAHCENRRRARKSGNGGSHTLAERKELFDLLGNVCFYCAAPPPLTVDHNLPLKRGGTDYISNILPACRSCNSRKSTRTATEFLAIIRRDEGE